MQQQKYKTYLVDDVKFPFCKGCGHTHAVRYLDKALTILQRDPAAVNLVSDIGCIGLVDSLFSDIHTVHTTHGRSTAFATGIELADSILHNSDLKTIVILGDGGATIGLLHIANAALMNIDITVLVCNNFLYGMTGGQQSGLTPLDMVTTTTPFGSINSPMDICKVAESCEAGFVARTLATDRSLPEVMAQAINYPGFALVEILEICTEYGTKYGNVDENKLKEIVEQRNLPMGVLVNRSDRNEFSEQYKSILQSETDDDTPSKKETFIDRRFIHHLKTQKEIVIAGAAGEHVQLASFLLLQAAIQSGLHATQKNDNPVTQGLGYSLSEVILSPFDIYYTGIQTPDYVIITSMDGLNEITANGTLKNCSSDTTYIVDDSILFDPLMGNRIMISLKKTFGNEKAAIGAIGICLQLREIIPFDSFENVLKSRYKDDAKNIIQNIRNITQNVVL